MTQLTTKAAAYQSAMQSTRGLRGSALSSALKKTQSLAKALGPEDRQSLQRMHLGRMADSIEGRAEAHPEKAEQLKSIADKVRALPTNTRPGPMMGGGGMPAEGQGGGVGFPSGGLGRSADDDKGRVGFPLAAMGGAGITGLFGQLTRSERQVLAETMPSAGGQLGMGGLFGTAIGGGQ